MRMLIGLANLLLLAACTSVPTPAPNQPTPQPLAIDSFSANPNPSPINLGVQFSWSILGGGNKTCKLDVNNDGTFEYTLNACDSTSKQVHTYSAVGTYTAKLVVSDPSSTLEKTTAVSVIAENKKPNVIELIAQQTTNPLRVRWVFKVSDAEGDVLTCKLDVNNDGEPEFVFTPCSSNGVNSSISSTAIDSSISTHASNPIPNDSGGAAEYTYPAQGTYTAKLEVSDAFNTASSQATIKVPNLSHPEILTFSLRDNPVLNNFPTAFSFKVSNPNPGNLVCTLSTGDGQTFTYNPCPEQVPIQRPYSFRTQGTFTASLHIQDDFGNSAARTLPFTVGCLVTNLSNTGPGSLRDQVGNPNCEFIPFDPQLSGTLTLLSPIHISRSLQIVANNPNPIAISGNHTTRLFTITGNFNVAFDGLTLRNGLADQGGAIYASGNLEDIPVSLSLSNMTFSNNNALYGGAVFLEHMFGTSRLSIRNSTFVGNQASISGGAIYGLVLEQLAIQNSVFRNNMASEIGGAILASGVGMAALALIDSSRFEQNSTGVNGIGGALSLQNFQATLNQCSFVENQTSGWGSGGAMTATNSTLTLRQTTFRANQSGLGGGLHFNGSTRNLAIEGSTFNSNRAISGGGAYIASAQTTVISNSVFKNNQAMAVMEDADTGRGGALLINNASGFQMQNAVVQNNSAQDGGGMFLSFVQEAALLSSQVLNNQASQKGGGIYFDFGSLSLLNSRVLNNQANVGGGIYLFSSVDYAPPTTLNLPNSILPAQPPITNNTAEVSGGGVFGIGGSVINGDVVNGISANSPNDTSLQP